jgi:hypothetical protein
MSIFDDVLSYIRAPQPETFDALALRVFRYQAEHVPAYRAYLQSQGVAPQAIHRLEDIPPVSTLAFKYARLENQCETPSAASRLFLTSGTTEGREQRGRHLVLYPEIYRASALKHLCQMLFPDAQRTAMLALHPTADRMPESSLSQMITWCIDEFGSPLRLCAATREGIDVDLALDFLRQCEIANESVSILSTTAACGKLFERLAKSSVRISLAGGSRLMDTGGAKGQISPLSSTEVMERASYLLGLDRAKIINEYGMTEICSQLYDATSFNSNRTERPEARVKLGPSWLRPYTFDPSTLRPFGAGQSGLLGFFDLANVGSVSMIVTEDFGTVDVQGGVRIQGRTPSAGARGCALSIKEFAEREQRLTG